jgi:DNA polymerase I-like protein with 3'-5' exonuclease and polymerase domains
MPDVTPVYKPLILSELNPPMNVTLVTDGSGLEKLKRFRDRIGAEIEPEAGLDTETNITVDFWNRRVRTLQLGDKNEQFVIDMLAFAETEERLVESQGFYGKHNGDIYRPVFEVIDPILITNKFLKVGVNLPFEYEVLHWNFGRRIWHLFSTDYAERVLEAGRIYLKKYAEFSMLRLMERYFGVTIDKSEQQSFDLKSPLTESQILYAGFDTRAPLALRTAQMKRLTAEQLKATAQIENDALGAYVDMHLVGQNLDDARWLRRIESVKQRRIEELKILDAEFIPVVGHKDSVIDYVEISRREKIWREGFEQTTPEEMKKAAECREEKDKTRKLARKLELDALRKARAEKKADARESYQELSKDRTKKLRVMPKCEGEAFMNYGSNPQLLEGLKKFAGMKHLESVADDSLLKFNDRPMIQVLRRYRKGKKETGTYGVNWTQRWVTKPGKEEGWRHPGDGRLHCVFNQLEAETGRSSSAKPNAQNLPKDDDVRACFICDPPDESVRISVCCDDDTTKCGDGVYLCNTCKKLCETKAEEYCIVTVDMSGAELRIIAELANAKSWIMAFAKGEDVHSVSTEILYPEKWPTLTVRSKLKPEKWTIADCKTEKVPLFNPDGTPLMKKNKKGVQEHVHVPPCSYYAVKENGELAHQKCECPEHKALRDGTKQVNFLLCYGGGPDALADALGITLDAAKELMSLHRSKFPDVWGYLERSGELAKQYREARDMFGRRRLFPEPTYDTAREWYIEEEAEKLEFDDDAKAFAIFNFTNKEGREPDEEEYFALTHREPTPQEIKHAMKAMYASIGRRGKNHAIQGTNASIIKRAMGCGFDREGTPYLWHTLPKYKARLQNMVHDELVIHCPKRYGERVMALVGDAFKRAAGEVMKQVVMEHDGNIAERWMK